MATNVTILITTRNRKDELRKALHSAVRQDITCEVLVVDDASTDGTPDMVRAEFPGVRLEVSPEARGYIVQRNLGARLATGEIIVSIDDDATLPSPQIARQVCQAFDHPRVGVVSIPFIDVHVKPGVIVSPAVGKAGVFCCRTFTGTAYAIRRDLFLSLGGFREALFHFTEEVDFAIRLLDAGYVVRLGEVDPIHHFCSPRRVASHAVIYRARNRILWAWWNTPWFYLLGDMLAGSFNILRYGAQVRKPHWSIRGLAFGLWTAFAKEMWMRRPVRHATFKQWHKIKHRVVELSEIEDELNPVLPEPVLVPLVPKVG